jgi:hypothetical protein
MSPFWSTFLCELRGRGRNGILFMGVVLVLVSLAMVAAMLSTDLLHNLILPVVLGFGVILLVLLGRAFWRACTRKYEHGPVGELSCDELNKARSKLMNNRIRRSS